jgi:hypothetical protein
MDDGKIDVITGGSIDGVSDFFEGIARPGQISIAS